MAYTHHQLKEKTVVELRDIAKDIQHEAVQGYTQLNKEHLIVALCAALHIPMYEHHEVVGIDKAGVKAKMRALKKERDAAVEAHDSGKLKALRRQIHHLNRRIREHMI
jgi:DNA-binding IclR family transcriptional regulator